MTPSPHTDKQRRAVVPSIHLFTNSVAARLGKRDQISGIHSPRRRLVMGPRARSGHGDLFSLSRGFSPSPAGAGIYFTKAQHPNWLQFFVVFLVNTGNKYTSITVDLEPCC